MDTPQESDTQPQEATEPEISIEEHQARGARIAWRVLGGILTLAIFLGILAYYNYSQSSTVLNEAFVELGKKGTYLDTEDCVPVVMDWHESCAGMKTLCDHAIPMAMTHCLSAPDSSKEAVEDLSGSVPENERIADLKGLADSPKEWAKQVPRASLSAEWEACGAAVRAAVADGDDAAVARELAAFYRLERKDYCDSFTWPASKSKWTYAKCKEIKISKDEGKKRDRVKACGNAFGAIENFCRHGGKGVRL